MTAIIDMQLRHHVSRNIELTHARAREQFIKIRDALDNGFREGHTKTRFGVFETYRSPIRQVYLLEQRMSKASAFQSAHQYGLAVDYVPFEYIKVGKETKRQWSWDPKHDYGFLREIARKYGCDIPIDWDLCHCEHPLWWHVKDELI